MKRLWGPEPKRIALVQIALFHGNDGPEGCLNLAYEALKSLTTTWGLGPPSVELPALQFQAKLFFVYMGVQ